MIWTSQAPRKHEILPVHLRELTLELDQRSTEPNSVDELGVNRAESGSAGANSGLFPTVRGGRRCGAKLLLNRKSPAGTRLDIVVFIIA
jgi:hypothetical protein